MLDVKKLIAKMLNAIGNKQDKLSVTTPSISISATTGSVYSTSVRRWGNFVQLYLAVQNSSTVTAGSNIFVGTVNTTGLRPVLSSRGVGFYAAHAIVGSLQADGSLNVRNASSTNIGAVTGTNNISLVFTYIVA